MIVLDSCHELMSGKNIIYLLSGQTSSGKTSSLFGTTNKKPDNVKPEKGLANQIFDILTEELPDNFSVSLVCQQIFNETVFDLLKKV
jgi:type II secretory ATPase GspE/PulE/Tfp pilus assembly ATPase PilB-like protein